MAFVYGVYLSDSFIWKWYNDEILILNFSSKGLVLV